VNYADRMFKLVGFDWAKGQPRFCVVTQLQAKTAVILYLWVDDIINNEGRDWISVPCRSELKYMQHKITFT